MYSLAELTANLQELYYDYTGANALSILPLAPAGSGRKYFRIKGEQTCVIATYNPNNPENETFFYYADLFKNLGLNVPHVLAINKPRDIYLQSDLGNVSLYDLVQQSWAKDEFNDLVKLYYRDVVCQLVRFQVEAHKSIDYKMVLSSTAFDKKAALDDLLYFKYYFIRLHQVTFDDRTLDKEFDLFASFISEAPHNFFMYRDFQSRNIMVHNGILCFIDFQGGKKGPLQYDLVSLLYQAKARIPNENREELKHLYLDELAKRTDIEPIQFNKYYPTFIYLRLMQVLGAYGFRGIIQGKKHFIESIPFALVEIEKLMQQYPLPFKLPQLESVLHQLIPLKNHYLLPDSFTQSKLTITISSFSYLQGGPPYDKSGNGGGFVFDCRALPNPGRIDQYKMLTGQDAAVVKFFDKEDQVQLFLDEVYRLTIASVDNYLKRNFNSLMISFGCTGGQHRSVFCAEKTAAFLKQKYPNAAICLRHIQLEKKL